MVGMQKYRVLPGDPQKLGVGRTKEGCQFAVSMPKEREVSLLLYPRGQKEPCHEIPMPYHPANGEVRSLFLENFQGDKYEYNYLIDGEVYHDPYTRLLVGRKEFGGEWPEDPHEVRCGFLEKGQMTVKEPLQIPFEEMVLYKVHVRGYTKEKHSKVKKKGTFFGLIEKIPYWKELGINAIELMPAYEFEERKAPGSREDSHAIYQVQAQEQLNYWGYTHGYYYAPKDAYAAGNRADREFKALIEALHEAGMECIMEFFFDYHTSAVQMVEILRFWKTEYQVDGFHLLGDGIAQDLLVQDPLLSNTKLFFLGIWDEFKDSVRPGDSRRLAEYNGGYSQDIRKWLKSDEGAVASAANHMRRNPSGYGMINYLTMQDGFTLADLVSYDQKHNEANGEDNRDGSEYNYSWNCGAEGPTRKQSIRQLRKKQMRNAWLLLLLSQGTPLIYGGDEFGNSQNGNNNAYCQDNETGWTDWQSFKKNEDMTEFVKAALAFRKENPILHLAWEPKGSDYRSVGYPDISYHSRRAWYAGMEHTSRSLGIMYGCSYGKKEEEKFLYLAYNFHWEESEFALPKLPEGCGWKDVIDTSDMEGTGFCPKGRELLSEDDKTLLVPPRTVMVLEGRRQQ